MVSMPSFEVLQPMTDHCGENGQLDEFQTNDFVVISEPAVVQNGQSHNCSIPPDVVYRLEDIHKQMIEMHEENCMLKQKVKRSSEVMLEQLNIIEACKRQLVEAKAKHSLIPDKSDIYKNLQRDKEELEQQNTELQKQIKVLKEKIEQLERQMQDSSEAQSKLQEELKQAVVEKEREDLDMKKQFEYQGIKLIAVSEELDAVRTKLMMLQKENADLMTLNKEILRQVNKEELQNVDKGTQPSVFNDDESGYAIVLEGENKNSDFASPSLTSAIIKQSELQENIMSVRDQLEIEQVKVESLSHLLDEKEKLVESLEQRSSELTRDLDAVNHLLRTEHEEFSNKLCISSLLSEEFKERCERLEKELEDCKRNLEESKAEHSTAMAALSLEKKYLDMKFKEEAESNECNRKTLAETKVNLQNLTEQHEVLLMQLANEKETKIAATEQATTMKYFEERQHSEQLGDMMAELVNVRQLLEAEQQKTRELESELKSLKTESESIPILKAQVEVYQSDFNIEKESCQNVLAELVKMKEENLSLEQQLMEIKERQTHGRSGRPNAGLFSGSLHSFGHKGRKDRSFSSRSPEQTKVMSVTEPQSQIIECPKCGLTYTDEGAAFNHIGVCIEDNATV